VRGGASAPRAGRVDRNGSAVVKGTVIASRAPVIGVGFGNVPNLLRKRGGRGDTSPLLILVGSKSKRL